MLERLEDLIKEKKSFAFETTLSGSSYLKFIRLARLTGYDVTFFFVWLNTVELAKGRVASRVIKGGHNIPEDVIERRYVRGIKNFSIYSAEADDWYLYDNSSSEYVLIAKSISGEKEIFNFEVFDKITEI